MDYYNSIKEELINNETYKAVKDYSKNRNDLKTYYNVGKLLSEAGKHYGEGIIKKYADKLTTELNKKYSTRYLFEMKKLYLFSKVHPLDAQLTISHYRILFSLNDDAEIEYYINQIINRNLGKRKLQQAIKNKEYERLPESTKSKIINNEKVKLRDMVKKSNINKK